ncbi:hypothetical protein HMPREF0762_01546 [Slackia exigua ATCC 700122]|uniref:Uncharacterized protein n=1 Tax=Slackia exigua (strain ATCC 700122 / DSM 15923 / CIP 105133 / JCM 11022 / KCTC 5966 / S-7) TaxID=649764 RepID=D0WI74_SLAES|nr:hypothetical protein HMPREF0762_01546 [Slackia exigua ATCC 700122]
MAVPAIEFIVQVSAFVSTVAWLMNGGVRRALRTYLRAGGGDPARRRTCGS